MRRIHTVRLGIVFAFAGASVMGVTAPGCGGSDGQTSGTDGGSDSAPGSGTDGSVVSLDTGAGPEDSGVDGTLPTGDDGGSASDGGGDDGGANDGGGDGGSNDGSGDGGGGSLDGGGDGGVDSGDDSGFDGGAQPVDAKLIIVHAAPGVGPVRLCFAAASGGATATVVPLAPLPDGHESAPPYAPPPAFGSEYDGGRGVVVQGTPGFYPGTIQAFPDITSLQAFALTPFVIDATLIAQETADSGTGNGGFERSCVQLLGSHGLGTSDSPTAGSLSASQFTQLPVIPAGTFADDHTYLMSITGCVPGFAPAATGPAAGVPANEICGDDFGISGNVALGIAPIDTSSVPTDGGWGVQFAHRSTMLQGTPVEFSGTLVHGPASDGLLPGVIVSQEVDGGDAGAVATEYFFPVGNAVKTTGSQITPYQSVIADPSTSSFAMVTEPGSGPDGGLVFSPWPASIVGSTTVPGDLIALPLPVIQQLSNWRAGTIDGGSPATYAPGTGFTFVVLGSIDGPQLTNPDGGAGANPAYDGRGLHIVAFPNVFTPVPLP